MKKAVEAFASEVLVAENRLRLYWSMIILGPVAGGFVFGMGLCDGSIDKEIAVFAFLITLALSVLGPFLAGAAMSIMPLKDMHAVNVRISLIADIVYSLAAIIALAGVTDWAARTGGDGCEVFMLLMWFITSTVIIVYVPCSVIVIAAFVVDLVAAK